MDNDQKYSESQIEHGKILKHFFDDVKSYITNETGFLMADEFMPEALVYTEDKCVDWYSDSATRSHSFGTFIDYGDQNYLLHLMVASARMHFGFLRYAREEGAYKLLPMEEADFQRFIGEESIIEPQGITLVRRNWGGGWCTLDLGLYSNLSDGPARAILQDFRSTVVFDDAIKPIIQYLMEIAALKETKITYREPDLEVSEQPSTSLLGRIKSWFS